jgi:small-conductance mechanosensitive channel
MFQLNRDEAEFVMRVGVSALFVVVGFAVLLFGLGQDGTARLAAGWLGAVLGFWLR